ncbi:carbohydrate ABC transporter membrane protein 2, CUT1 family [Paenibacillus sophorae]|uniref:Carbohydrate ABC transporter membrane protein 2, CUT1 family n=1 Tax=Paenibacillus sophorae TaxID=1333845 RepID=A0A1H8M132_9BACL|nr:carbohydrate ABC transporter permease [Paenibacillus sophorae]QWU17632.1 carbohydrate ABC transporter permease [Paenibacillus sophorae]SEO11102.1 carbohydrate ABC transporter membrane protein 2, CUT1 family [Paenibacillus sophorae]
MTNRKKALGIYILMSAAAIVIAFPVLWMFVMSVKPADELYRFPPTILPDKWEFANYTKALFEAGIDNGLINSLILAVGTLALSVTLSFPAAYALAKYEFKGKTILLLAILATQLIPGMAAIVPLFDILQRMHLVNTYSGLILIYTARTLPLNIWILKGFFQSIPNELIESSMVDGSSKIASLYRVALPLALPGIGAAAMFTFMQTWIDFILPLTMLFNEDKFPFSVMLYKFVGDPIMGTNYGVLFAAAALGTIPTLLIFALLQRFFVQGLTAGGVKG